MRLLINECLSPEVAARLREEGHDAVYVQEIGLSGAPDPTVYAQARLEGRVFVTLNVSDFGDARSYSDPESPGVIILRLPRASPAHVLQELRTFLAEQTQDSLRGCGFVLSSGGTTRKMPFVVLHQGPTEQL